MSEPIITSLLDTDLYKFTMMQCAFHHCKEAVVEYAFICRKPVDLVPLIDEIEEQITLLCNLTFREDELSYLGALPYIKPDYVNYLRTFQLNKKHITISRSNTLSLHIKGSWLETILFEVPLLAIISECYYRRYYPNKDLQEAKHKLLQKTEFLKDPLYEGFRFSDFGTRRRFSKEWQQTLLPILKTHFPKQLIGTSNVYFAKIFNLTPIGTMAHEFLQAFQVLAPNIVGSQHYALQIWLKEYGNALGIALTDVLTMDIFLQEFDSHLSRQYAGLRQDSGDPFLWAEKAIAHYQACDIDPRSKMLVFSDSLTFPKAAKIYQAFKDKSQLYFGIGTNLTNDVGVTPLDIVIKMTHTNHQPVIKISDSQGKTVSPDERTLQYVKNIFQIKD